MKGATACGSRLVSRHQATDRVYWCWQVAMSKMVPSSDTGQKLTALPLQLRAPLPEPDIVAVPSHAPTDISS